MTATSGKHLLAPRDVEHLADTLRQRGTFCAYMPPWPGAAAIALELHRLSESGVVVVTDGPTTMDRTAGDLASFAGFINLPDHSLIYPALESFPGHGAPPHPKLIGDRLHVLRLCHEPATPLLIVTSIQALMQKTVSPDWIRTQSITVTGQTELDPAGLLPWLEKSGYNFDAEVLTPGQASWRGGILDVWPPGHDWPLRMEFFGSTIDSLRRFDPADQRSREMLTSAEIPPASEREGLLEQQHSLFDHLPDGMSWIWVDRESITTHGEMYEHAAREAQAEMHIVPLASLPGLIHARHASQQVHLALAPRPEEQPWTIDLQMISGPPPSYQAAAPMDRIEEQRRLFVRELFNQVRSGWSLALFFSTPGGMDRFMETYGKDVKPSDAVTFHHGILSESFSSETLRILLVSDADVYGLRRDQPGRYDRSTGKLKKTESAGERIHTWTDIQPGDYVVHIEHGIGIYRGMHELETGGTAQETLAIEFAEGARLYVPVAQTHLLSRYIGVGKRRPELHALGGKRWMKEKVAAEKAVEDLASMLLETQAARDAKPGHAFSPDTNWQREFEATFPFRETPDQEQAISEVKADMEKTRPMDRLICGDVGYGKTEVAMRAAFKSVMDGKQVAVLVPTTVLAQQHFDSFTERMAAFPIRIESLSRFQTHAEQADILKRLADGTVDIVIGTHRLVQKDVHFRDLGLVIIDEEQRFGVKHKEFLKRMRQLVDVLTMTATPIPRTLYMSLTGAKDLSIIETAPVERLPIETIVTENRDDIVREAILRELNREGQVYYLHNRVGTIEQLHLRLANLVPEARIRVAHGQMNEHELSNAMRAFTRGEFDVLLCTTIIESGLNIPNVNTIIIERADRFGLSELYQLRGRVGRYKRKAYAYLLLPRHGQLFFMARQRIGAIKRYSSLGSGFKLAMRDLELRGAGNILGAEQSGHIATVGFDLYCQLLHRTVAKLKGEAEDPVIDTDLTLDFITLSPDLADAGHAAALPIEYMEDENVRVRMYRRIAAMTKPAEIVELKTELKDRFGPLPDPAIRLLLISELKIAASRRNIRRIEVDGEKVIMTRQRDYVMSDGKFPRLAAGKPTVRLRKLIQLVETA